MKQIALVSVIGIDTSTEYEAEFEIKLRLITKKRFIKLLMGKGIQKREATKLHNIFIKRYGHRTKIGLELFLAIGVVN